MWRRWKICINHFTLWKQGRSFGSDWLLRRMLYKLSFIGSKSCFLFSSCWCCHVPKCNFMQGKVKKLSYTSEIYAVWQTTFSDQALSNVPCVRDDEDIRTAEAFPLSSPMMQGKWDPLWENYIWTSLFVLHDWTSLNIPSLLYVHKPPLATVVSVILLQLV